MNSIFANSFTFIFWWNIITCKLLCFDRDVMVYFPNMRWSKSTGRCCPKNHVAYSGEISIPEAKKCSHTRVHPPHAHFIFVACCLISVVSIHEHPVGGGGFAKYYNDIHSGGEISAHVIRLVNTIFISTHWSGWHSSNESHERNLFIPLSRSYVGCIDCDYFF